MIPLFVSHYVTRVTELHVFVSVPRYESILRYIYHNGSTLLFCLHCLHMTTSTYVILSTVYASKLWSTAFEKKLFHRKFVIICAFYDTHIYENSHRAVRSCLVRVEHGLILFDEHLTSVKVRNYCSEIIFQQVQNLNHVFLTALLS